MEGLKRAQEADLTQLTSAMEELKSSHAAALASLAAAGPPKPAGAPGSAPAAGSDSVRASPLVVRGHCLLTAFLMFPLACLVLPPDSVPAAPLSCLVLLQCMHDSAGPVSVCLFLTFSSGLAVPLSPCFSLSHSVSLGLTGREGADGASGAYTGLLLPTRTQVLTGTHAGL